VQRRTSFAAEERGVGKHASATTGHGAPSSPSSAQKSRMSCPPCGQAGERNSPVNGESCEHSNWATNVNGTLPASTGHCSPGARSGGPPMQCGTVRVGLKPIAGLDRREDRVPMFAEAVFPDQRDHFLAGKQHIVVTHGRDHTHERVNAAVAPACWPITSPRRTRTLRSTRLFPQTPARTDADRVMTLFDDLETLGIVRASASPLKR
jgi:hypothetical protein